MPLNPADSYSSSAGITPNTTWTPFVTKHDTSSFYNWEQDNLPLYDLEERTDFLYEQLGFGGGDGSNESLTVLPESMSLVVSGDNNSGNGRVFTSLQAAVNAIPRILRFPASIEVVASGNLGSLDLDGIQCAQGGLLEIVNRGCAKAYSDKFGGIVSGHGAIAMTNSAAVLGSDALTWSHVSCIDLSAYVDTVWSRVQENIGVSKSVCQTQARRIFHRHQNPASHPGTGTGMRAFFSTVHQNARGHRPAKVQFSLHDPSGAGDLTAASPWSKVTSAVVNLQEYSRSGFSNTVYPLSVKDISVKELDVSAKNQTTTSVLKRSIPGTTFATNNYDQVAGLVYANNVSSIRVNNCNGPIYIRGFCVDGADTSRAANATPVGKYLTDIGALVDNSNGIILENISTTRCRLYGTEIRNSNVTMSRGFYSVRNYEVTNNTLGSTRRANNETAGLRAFNSTISVSADPLYASGADFLFHTQFNNVGMLLENSIFNAGTSGNNLATNIHSAYNNFGIKAKNSQISFDGRLDVYNNEYGLDFDNSVVEIDELTVENNEYTGIRANNSKIIYNKNHIKRTRSNLVEDSKGLRFSQIFFRNNGQHLVLDSDSDFTYPKSTNIRQSNYNVPANFGLMRMVQSHGVSDRGAKNTSIPAVDINHSRADLVHCRIDVSAMVGAHPTKGSAVLAKNNSEVNFLGTGSGTTMVIGPPTLAKQLHNAGIAADNSSKVSFRGPTVVAQFGVDVLADNNSTIDFGPHKNRMGEVDTSGFRLIDPWNHTAVELHSTRACLVANNNSVINMEDLGDYHAFWDISGASQYGANTDVPHYDLSSLCHRGSMQFYPNPAAAITNSIDSGSRQNIASALPDTIAGDRMKNARVGGVNGVNVLYQILDPLATTASAITKISVSLGGYCVQALGGSQVNVRNVHFPCGGPIANGTYFDPTKSEAYVANLATTGKTGNNNLLIWNIADTSRLNSSYISVSGNHPAKAAYHGPRAVYFSGTGGAAASPLGPVNEFASGTITGQADTSNVAYGAEYNPDTGRISLCDLYGLGVEVSTNASLGFASGTEGHLLSAISKAVHNDVNMIGSTSYQNRGPFRLYFSIDSAIKQIGYASGSLYGASPEGGNYPYFLGDNRPYQHLSQGYSLSGAAGVPRVGKAQLDNASSTGYQHLLLSSTDSPGNTNQYDGIANMALSGYYSSRDFGPKLNPNQIMLDESAANTFANAKNAAFRAVADRGGPKVTIYSSHDTSGGENTTTTTNQLGVGFRSSNIFDLRKGN